MTTAAELAMEEPTIHRTTVYSSTEFGLVQKDALPFPADVMGTYSCHGIEPSPFEPGMKIDKQFDG
jgi:hypothetical protein